MRAITVLLTAFASALCVLVGANAASASVAEKPRSASTRERLNPAFARRYDRELALIAAGGSDRTEWSVVMALRWLKMKQNADGSWGEDPVKPALTGLALLCYLGHGEDHTSPEFRRTVHSAVVWLMQQQDERGYFGGAYQRVYQHAIVTYALAEAYGMTGLDGLKPLLTHAVQRICEGQTQDGGWHYGYMTKLKDDRPWRGGDTSIGGWQIQALNAAWHAGIRLDDDALAVALRRAAADMKSRFSAETGFGYHGAKPSRTLAQNFCTTAIGTHCLLLLDKRDWRGMQRALDILDGYEFEWGETTGGAGGPLYGWFHATQAAFHASANPRENKHWKRWHAKFAPGLIQQQHRDGSWEHPQKGSTTAIGAVLRGRNFTIYSTAMCCLMLETYYRYPPATAEQDAPPVDEVEVDDFGFGDDDELVRDPDDVDADDGEPAVEDDEPFWRPPHDPEELPSQFNVVIDRNGISFHERRLSETQLARGVARSQAGGEHAYVFIDLREGYDKDVAMSLIERLRDTGAFVGIIPRPRGEK